MKIIRHVLFWSTVVLMLTLFYGPSYGSIFESFYFVCLLLPVVLATAYFFNYILVDLYLFKGRYWKFGLYTLYLLIISLNLEMLVVTVAFIVLAEYDYANMNPITADVSVLTITMYLVVLGLSFVRLFRFYRQNQSSISHFQKEIEKSSQETIVVKENRKNRPLVIDEIAYIESLSDYITIHLAGEKVMTKEKISKMESKLPNHFVRIHRSFLVNQRLIESFNKEQVMVLGQSLPISRTYKKQVMSVLE
ncbi:LytR/AlgR family response regulator transcription factor [Reichenbachiella ulvae]|uniref:LytTR family transcriptional regulator n=1 Tax=Reichenbachiella ulvae TaxID=2980104 RepID=A0ABT3CW52_9BACT|nr:LytTR family DNA-binding domain-containing protein [Reichenbachiella ulvae]MCV9387940.1 LytTR family transcriptional regulator [Reichenbachiella ulvae]